MTGSSLFDFSCGASELMADVESMTVPYRPITAEESFPQQWGFVTCEERAICLMCSRRAAKTYGVRLRTVKRSDERPGWRTLIIHHTRELGKQQIYETGDERNPGIRELMKSHGMAERKHNSTELNVTFNNGSFVQVVGCDKMDEVGKKLGFLWNDIVLIECQEFKDAILERLVDKTILPTLFDRAGSLTMEGTPSDIEAGVWFSVIKGLGDHQFKQFRWTLLENPYIPDVRESIISTMAMRGFKIDFAHPEENDVLIQREVFGRQVIDPTKLLYCYMLGKNDWPASGIPLVDSPAWRFAMGLDIGGAEEDNDRDVCVVWGWMVNDPEHLLWERESWEEHEQDSETFVDRVLDTYNRWHPMVAACGDTGGAGANKMLKVLVARFKGLEFTPKPTSVATSTRLLNDEFRSGRARVNPLGLIARDAKICTKVETYHSDVMAAARYGHHGAYNFLAKADPPVVPENTDEAIRNRRRRAWQREMKNMRNPWAGEGGWRQ